MSYDNKANTVYFDEIFNEILDMIYEDIFGYFDCSHIGTFAEFKHIDEFDKPPLPDDIINRSSCAWSTCDIQEAIRRAKDVDKSRNKKKLR